MSPIRNYVSVGIFFVVVMLTDWSLWVSIPVGLLAGGLAAQVIGDYLPEKPRTRSRLNRPPKRHS